MKTVYVCTEGEYSDYHICGVFDNKELAEKFCQQFGCEIEEWNLNPFAVELKKGYSPYFVRMTKEGEALQVDIKPSPYGFGNGDGSHGFDIKKNMCLHCMAKSSEHAVKIANERRVSLIDSNQWAG